eukprot:2842263-Prorocentrum_lima.AAC.1
MLSSGLGGGCGDQEKGDREVRSGGPAARQGQPQQLPGRCRRQWPKGHKLFLQVEDGPNKHPQIVMDGHRRQTGHQTCL